MPALFTTRSLAAALLSYCYVPLLCAQVGRTTDWWSFAGDAQRSGWEKNEQRFTKDEVKDFRLLWKRKLDSAPKGVRTLAPPVVLGNLIGSRGFKELAFVAASNGGLWALDADLDRVYWQKNFAPAPSHLPAACRVDEVAAPTLPAPITFRLPSRRPATEPPATPAPPPAPMTPEQAAADNVARLRRMYAPRPLFLASSDGSLHRVNMDNGADLLPPLPFLPANARVHSLNATEEWVYAVTSPDCSGAPAAIWSINAAGPTAKVNSFAAHGVVLGSPGGVVLGPNEEVYVQTGAGQSDPASGVYAHALLSLTPRELKPKDYFLLPDSNSEALPSTPVAFNFKGRELIALAGPDNRIYLLDANTLGGADHKTPLFHTAPLVTSASSSDLPAIRDGLSTWESLDGARYILAAVWGAASPATPHGAIVAFKLVADASGAPSLTPAWTSLDLSAPSTPVIAQGVVFALSNGEFTVKTKKLRRLFRIDEHPAKASHASLYAFDGATGQQLYTTGDQVAAPGNLSGLSIANSRVYFSTIDGTLYAFGKYLETTQ